MTQLPKVVTCKFCHRPVNMAQRDWKPGQPAYCTDHAVLADNDPFMVGQAGLDFAEWLHDLPDEKLIHWPWQAVNDLAGPLVPGRLTYIAAFPGGGKTTFLTHCLYYWIASGKSVLYLPLEADPGEVYTRLACLDLGVSADEALSFRLRKRADEGDERAAQQWADLKAMYTAMRFRHDLLDRLHIVPIQSLTAESFHKALRVAQLRESDLVVVDHVDHVESDADGGDGIGVSNALQSQALRYAKHLQIPMVLATQLNSSRANGDRLAHYRPPAVDWLYNKGKKEQMAANILGLSRMLDTTKGAELLTEVRNGTRSPQDVALLNAMGVTGMKLRYGGGLKEKTVTLRYEHGRITDMDEPDARDLAASRHGLLLGSPSNRR